MRHLDEGIATIGTATTAHASGLTVAHEDVTSYRRAGPEVRGTWSRYSDQRLAEASEPNINRARVEVRRRTTASTHGHISSSPASGWTTSIAHVSGAETEMEVPDHSVLASASKNCDATASQAVRGSGGTTVQHAVEHNSPQITTSLPHEHVRSPTQSKPGRGSPYPLFHNAGNDTHSHEDMQRSMGSSSNARAQHIASTHLHMSDPLAQSPPLDQQPLTMLRPLPHAQPRGSMNYADSAMATDKLIDLAYKITDGMAFKVPPSTPRRPDLPA